MADRATMIDKDGNRKSVYVHQLTEKDLDNEFQCCGRVEHDGEICCAPLRPSFHLKYFYQASLANPHKKGCPYYRKAKETPVNVLDQRAEKLKIKDLLKKIGKTRGETPGGPSGGPKTPLRKEEDDEDDLYKPVIPRHKHPRDIRQIVDLLKKLPLSARYADSTVGQLIVDERNIESYRLGEIPIGKPLVVIGRKTNPYAYGVMVGSEQWLLADFWATGINIKNPILYLLNVDQEAKQKLLAYARKATEGEPVKIAVFAEWKRNWTYTGNKVYETTTLLNSNLIDGIND